MRRPPEGSDMTPGWPAIWWGKGVWSPGVSVGSIAGLVWSADYTGEHVGPSAFEGCSKSGLWVYVILFVCLCTLLQERRSSDCDRTCQLDWLSSFIITAFAIHASSYTPFMYTS